MIKHRIMINNQIVCLFAVLFLCSACDSGFEHVATSYPDQQSLGFQQFSRQCSTCHRPPMPDAHVADAWPEVLIRMQQHKEQRGLLVMSNVEQQQVLAYLQAHAKPVPKKETSK